MNIVSLSFTTHANVAIPSNIHVYDDDKTLFLKAESLGDIIDWLSEALEELESNL